MGLSQPYSDIGPRNVILGQENEYSSENRLLFDCFLNVIFDICRDDSYSYSYSSITFDLLLSPTDILHEERKKDKKEGKRRCRGSNPGHPRDRREYSPLYYNDLADRDARTLV